MKILSYCWKWSEDDLNIKMFGEYKTKKRRNIQVIKFLICTSISQEPPDHINACG